MAGAPAQSVHNMDPPLLERSSQLQLQVIVPTDNISSGMPWINYTW